MNVAKTTNNILSSMDALIDRLEALPGRNSTKRGQAAIEALQKTIVIHTSVKDYTNDFTVSQGFHGGSLGGNVEKQISNIILMQQLGGINFVDKDWLINAVYNSGPGMLYAQKKNLVETILSSVAAMLLFEDYGAQAIWYK